MQLTKTLRTLNNLTNQPATLANATLILVDYQNTYTQGVMELVGWENALAEASALLQRARDFGTPIIHVMHDGGQGSSYDITTSIGQICEHVAPIQGEAVVVKNTPNAFVNTNLGELVDQAGNQQIIVIGFMTHMCVTFTSEGGFLRGNEVTVVADACATRNIYTELVTVTAENLHQSALATISDLYGVVVKDGSLIG